MRKKRSQETEIDKQTHCLTDGKQHHHHETVQAWMIGSYKELDGYEYVWNTRTSGRTTQLEGGGESKFRDIFLSLSSSKQMAMVSGKSLRCDEKSWNSESVNTFFCPFISIPITCCQLCPTHYLYSRGPDECRSSSCLKPAWPMIFTNSLLMLWVKATFCDVRLQPRLWPPCCKNQNATDVWYVNRQGQWNS